MEKIDTFNSKFEVFFDDKKSSNTIFKGINFYDNEVFSTDCINSIIANIYNIDKINITLVDVSGGGGNKTYKVLFLDQILIFHLCDKKFMKYNFFLKTIYTQSLAHYTSKIAPKIIAVGKNYFIDEFIGGKFILQDKSKKVTDESNLQDVLNLANLVGDLHNLPTEWFEIYVSDIRESFDLFKDIEVKDFNFWWIFTKDHFLDKFQLFDDKSAYINFDNSEKLSFKDKIYYLNNVVIPITNEGRKLVCSHTDGHIGNILKNSSIKEKYDGELLISTNGVFIDFEYLCVGRAASDLYFAFGSLCKGNINVFRIFIKQYLIRTNNEGKKEITNKLIDDLIIDILAVSIIDYFASWNVKKAILISKEIAINITEYINMYLLNETLKCKFIDGSFYKTYEGKYISKILHENVLKFLLNHVVDSKKAQRFLLNSDFTISLKTSTDKIFQISPLEFHQEEEIRKLNFKEYNNSKETNLNKSNLKMLICDTKNDQRKVVKFSCDEQNKFYFNGVIKKPVNKIIISSHPEDKLLISKDLQFITLGKDNINYIEDTIELNSNMTLTFTINFLLCLDCQTTVHNSVIKPNSISISLSKLFRIEKTGFISVVGTNLILAVTSNKKLFPKNCLINNLLVVVDKDKIDKLTQPLQFIVPEFNNIFEIDKTLISYDDAYFKNCQVFFNLKEKYLDLLGKKYGDLYEDTENNDKDIVILIINLLSNEKKLLSFINLTENLNPYNFMLNGFNIIDIAFSTQNYLALCFLIELQNAVIKSNINNLPPIEEKIYINDMEYIYNYEYLSLKSVKLNMYINR